MLGPFSEAEEILGLFDSYGELPALPPLDDDILTDLLDGFGERLAQLAEGCGCPSGNPPCSYCTGNGHEIERCITTVRQRLRDSAQWRMTRLPGWGRF